MVPNFRHYAESVFKYVYSGRRVQPLKPLTKSKRRLLLEPLEDRLLLAWDLTISTSPTNPLLVNHAGGSYTAIGSGANINVTDILNDLNAALDVSISNGTTGAESGAIGWSAGAPLNYTMAAPRSLQI